MSFIDMIEKFAGPAALGQIGARVGLSSDQLQAVIASLAPIMVPKLTQHAVTGGFNEAPNTLPEPGSDDATTQGNTVLGAIFGSKNVSRAVAGEAAAQSGVGANKVEALLPQLASLAQIAFHSRGSPSQEKSGGLGGLGGLASILGKGFGIS